MLSAKSNIALNNNSSTDSMAECIMPGIYLSKNFLSWQEEQLRGYSFTHIIIIDKHIQQLYYPGQNGSIFKANSLHTSDMSTKTQQQTTSTNICDIVKSNEQQLKFSKEFDVIDLNFGDKTYLTTVLPNCYRAVRFINKAVQAGGTILVIDCNGGEQKCVTIVVAYLMYKYNINFNKAFARLKENYTNANLDRYYISQLYEYEPILKVQRAHSYGHSCSRELHAAVLKRKRSLNGELDPLNLLTNHNHNASIDTDTDADADAEADADAVADGDGDCDGSDSSNVSNDEIITTASLLNNFNPLNKFNAMDIEEQLIAANTTNTNAANATAINSCSLINTNEMNDRRIAISSIRSVNLEHLSRTATAAITKYNSSAKGTNGWYYYDDYIME